MAILTYLFGYFLFRFDADTPVSLYVIINGALLENWEFGKQQQWWLNGWQQRLDKETAKEINIYIYMNYI